MSGAERPRPTLASRLVARYVVVVLAALGLVWVLLDRILAVRPGLGRPLIAVGLAAAAAVGTAAAWLAARAAGRSLRRITDSVRDLPVGAEGPEPDTYEEAALAETLSTMAGNLGTRVEEVRRDRQSLELILSAMAEGVVLVEGDDRISYANPAARRLLGPVGGTLRSLAPHPLRVLVAEARASGDAGEDEVETGFPARVLRARSVPLGAGRVLLVARDVTAPRRVEAMRRDFVADASHELKTPAASIHAAAETLEQALGEDPEAARRFAGRLRRDAIRLSRIVSDLLDLSRLESERPDLGPVRLDRVAGEEAARLGDQAREAGIRVEVRTEPTPVLGSRKDLALLVRNLLENAVRYTSAGGDVRVEVRPDDARAAVTVADTGIGIPRRHLPRIFERFYRVDRARSRDTGGTGLGLSIARHVVEQHGGTIEAESELGRGSTFRVRLPLAGDPQASS